MLEDTQSVEEYPYHVFVSDAAMQVHETQGVVCAAYLLPSSSFGVANLA
jgi:hypothetical protein